MALLAAQDAEYVSKRQNETHTEVMDPLRGLNKTEIRETRIQFNWLSGEIDRKPTPYVFTKYKKRLFREMYQKCHYDYVNKYAGLADVSCNYLNNIDDSNSMYSFRCVETSHKCPDGNFVLKPAFNPKEGPTVTWGNVVIVVLVGADRGDYLQAMADTWVARLNEEAELFIARDGKQPEIPHSIMHRKNTVIFDYEGAFGLEDLDTKAYKTWGIVLNRYIMSERNYFLKIDDDTMVFSHNLMRFLNKVNYFMAGYEEPIYFGHPFCGHGDLAAMGYEKWCYAGGGAYGMNKEALLIMSKQISGGCVYFYDYMVNGNFRPVNDRYGGHYEDVMIGRCLRQAKRREKITGTSLLACGSFVPYAALHYYDRYGSVEEMCSKLNGDVVTMHNLEVSAIRYLNHILFEFPMGFGKSIFDPHNERMQEMVTVCEMRGKKMRCDLELVPSMVDN